MLEQEQINQLASAISDIDNEEVDELYPKIVNLIANKLNALYVELYFVNSSKNLALPRAGSGEIGKIFAKHDHNCYLKVHNEFTTQIGPVIVLGKVRVVDWKLGEITAYTLHPKLSKSYEQSHSTVVADTPPLFWRPELGGAKQEIYLPIRSSNENVGALALYFTESIISSNDEIYLLQRIADCIGDLENS